MICLIIFSIGLFQTLASSDAEKIGLNKILLEQHEPIEAVRKSTRMPVLEFIEQRLDNFNPTNNDTWQMVISEVFVFVNFFNLNLTVQRYYRNDEFFVDGGPIFIFVGGQWSIFDGLLLGGHMYDMAEELGGQMFYTEHRYYGSSRPTR